MNHRDAAGQLYNSGYIIVDGDNAPLQPDKHKFRLIDDAKRIKLYAANYCIETAREEGREVTDVSVRNVSAALGLNEAEFRICQALTERDLQELAQVPPHRAIGG